MTSGVRDIEVVRYDAALEDAVVRLGSRAFGIDDRTYRSYFLWKYLANPCFPEPIAYVALDRGGRAVGLRGFYGSRWKIDDEVVTIPSADEFAIANDRRRTGLATALMQSALADLRGRGFSLVLSTSAGTTTTMLSLATGWKSVGAMEPLDLRSTRRSGEPTSFGRFSRYLLARAPGARTRLRRAAGGTVRRQARVLRELGEAGTGAPSRGGRRSIVVTDTPPSSAMAHLSERLASDDRIRSVRDAAFTDWRYANPVRDYRFVLAEGEGHGIEGYLVLARHLDMHVPPPVHISDWVGVSEGVLEDLLCLAVNACRSVGLRIWSASLAGDAKELLARAGFEPGQTDLRARGMPCVLVRNLDGSQVVTSADWDVRLVDSMHG